MNNNPVFDNFVSLPESRSLKAWKCLFVFVSNEAIIRRTRGVGNLQTTPTESSLTGLHGLRISGVSDGSTPSASVFPFLREQVLLNLGFTASIEIKANELI